GPPTPEEVFYEGNTTVYVKVRAIINDHGKIIYGPFSPVVTAVTNPAPIKATDFTATLEGDNVHLRWTDNSISEAAYFVTKYKTGQFTNGVPIFQTPANATEYTDYGGLEQNVEYTYVVRPVNIFEFSTARPEWWPTLMDDALTIKTTIMKVTLPAAVSDLAAVAIDSSTIDLSFTLVSENGSWYNVEIATSPDGPFSLWSDSGEPFMEVFYLEPNTTYYFRVQGVLELNDGVHYGPYSNIASATTLPVSATLPEAPLARLATFVTPTSFTANWIPVVGADYYELDVFNIKDSKYLSGYEGKIVYDTSLSVIGTRASRRYTYTVRAVNENGESVNSNTILVTPIKALTLRTVCSDTPTSFRVWKIINNNQVPVQVSWNVNNTTQSGTHLATIGESYFATQTVSGLNKTTIRWLDDKLNEHFSTKSSTWKACDNDSMARSFVEAEEVEDVNTSLSIVAYPNSIQDKFHLKISSLSDREVQIEIINLQGKSMIKRTAVSNTDLEFDASGYSSGIYLVRASQGTRFKTLKLLKQ
ncbi:MAG TPA: T9SS type A sorting domain-containing protein, partial [Cyclobacteriaceae bacterium]|nr:T9SS type A sorting domain-containing protein [Cyclobacteriaceae bacterium]